MRVTRFVAPTTADQDALATWLTAVLVAMQVADFDLQRPESALPPIDDDWSPIVRTLPLSTLPPELRPIGVDPIARSLRVDFAVRAVSTSTQVGTTPEGFPVHTSTPRGYEGEVICSQGSGKSWDVESFPDIFRDVVVLSTDDDGEPITMDHATVTRGTIVLPAAPVGWAVVDPIHPSVVYAEWQSPVVERDPNAPIPPPPEVPT